MGKHSASNPSPRRDDRRRDPRLARAREGASSRKAAGEESYRLSDPSSRRSGSLETAPARLRVERDRRRSKWRRVLAWVGVVLLTLVALAAAGSYLYLHNVQKQMHGTAQQSAEIKAALKKADPGKPYNVLLLGSDYRQGDTAWRSDSMILAKIDPKSKRVWMISIPRDTRVMIAGRGYHKINQAHFFGGPAGAIKAVEELTGEPINHYVEMNFSGFKGAVDALGGVWVDVPYTIDDWKADSSPNHRAKHIDAGYQLLDGEHALTFVRSRAFPDADFTRMKSQQLFFKALADQMMKSDVTRLPKVVSAVAPYVLTDMNLTDMIKTAQALARSGSKNVFTVSLKGEWRSPFVYLDEAQLREVVDAFHNERPFETSGTVAPAATSKKPADISVTIHNGSGISGVAKQVSTILKAKGFNVGDVGNANQNVYSQTLIVYKTDRNLAQTVAGYMPSGVKIVQSRGMYSFTTDVLIVVGKDWDLSKVPAAPVTN